MNKSKEIGYYGEYIAQKCFISKGFKILCGNFCTQYGEIDIIADNGNVLAFVEVKTRKDNSIYSPIQSIDNKKVSRIIKTAYIYLNEYDGLSMPRFDIVEIFVDKSGIAKRIKHIENAFSTDIIGEASL